MKYEMIPRPWLQKWQLEHKCMAGCKKRSEVVQDILDDYDDYMFYRLPEDVRYDIELDLYAKYNNTSAHFADNGMWRDLQDITEAEDQDRRAMTREWWLKHEED